MNTVTPNVRPAKSAYVRPVANDDTTTRHQNITAPRFPAPRGSMAALVKQPSATQNLRALYRDTAAIVTSTIDRIVAMVEPYYDWGRISVENMDARTQEELVEGNVRYFDLQWLGIHLGFQFGRTPREARR